MTKKLTLQAQGDFAFTFYIEKAVPLEEDGNLIVEGVASTINVDHDNERMAEDALRSMATMINDKGVPLRLEHNQESAAIIGNVYKAWVDSRNQLWIRAAIDPSHPSGPMIHSSLKQGAKFGLSVGGRVRNAVRELVESTGKMVKTFYDVVLDEVSVTRKPANYDAWLFAKSIKDKDAEVSPYYDSPLYDKFLFENPQLDYLQQFAKSIPDASWKRINNDIQKDMSKDEMKDKTEKAADEKMDEKDTKKAAEGDKKEDDKAEKSFVTKSEFDSFSSMVTKGFAGLTSILKGMNTTPKETTNPDKALPEDETQQTAKGEKGEKKDEETEKSVEDGNGTQDGKKIAAGNANDQDNPSKTKPKAVGDEARKASEGDKKDEDKAEKASEGTKEDEKAEKAADDEKPDDYKVKSIGDAIAHITNLSKTMSGEKVTKSEDKVEKSEKSDVSSIDAFAVSISKFADSIAERFEKSGTRVPGLARMIADEIRGNKEIQSEIMAMSSEPSFKKSRSVSGGVPFMITKYGQKFALTAQPIANGEVRKSSSTDGKSFKDVFKSEFSSFKPE